MTLPGQLDQLGIDYTYIPNGGKPIPPRCRFNLCVRLEGRDLGDVDGVQRAILDS